jgi:isopenicillin-N N-acyltransferase-like protein
VRYREIDVDGTPHELGRQLGEAARDEIRGFCEIALERAQRTVNISRDKTESIANSCIDLARAYDQDMIDELEGTAEAADVTLVDLMVLQVRNQLTSEPASGCTSLSCVGSAEGAVVAQNWDNDPSLDEFTIVLTRRPRGKPALTTLTQAGLIAYIGFNDAGIGACLNTLPAPSREIGVPHYFTLRGIYEATSLDGAVRAVRRAQRAIPANIILATPDGPADLEVTIDDVHVLRDEAAGRVTHTNHCLQPDLAAINADFPELIQSRPRKQRIDKLLEQADQSTSIEMIKRMLSDHENYPRSICRHRNDDPDYGFWQTVFSVIIEPQARRMHVARGTPCDHPFEIYRMN